MQLLLVLVLGLTGLSSAAPKVPPAFEPKVESAAEKRGAGAARSTRVTLPPPPWRARHLALHGMSPEAPPVVVNVHVSVPNRESEDAFM